MEIGEAASEKAYKERAALKSVSSAVEYIIGLMHDHNKTCMLLSGVSDVIIS